MTPPFGNIRYLVEKGLNLSLGDGKMFDTLEPDVKILTLWLCNTFPKRLADFFM